MQKKALQLQPSVVALGAVINFLTDLPDLFSVSRRLHLFQCPFHSSWFVYGFYKVAVSLQEVSLQSALAAARNVHAVRGSPGSLETVRLPEKTGVTSARAGCGYRGDGVCVCVCETRQQATYETRHDANSCVNQNPVYCSLFVKVQVVQKITVIKMPGYSCYNWVTVLCQG